MNTICLTVLTIIGQFCYDGATPIGNCFAGVVEAVQYCTARPADLPVFLSAYDPVYCLPEVVGSEYEPINCHSQETAMTTGSGANVMDWYNRGAACPIGWNWRMISIPGVGEFRCIDSGGGITPGWKLVTDWVFNPATNSYTPITEYRWVITLDILYPVWENGWPVWSLMIYSQWVLI